MIEDIATWGPTVLIGLIGWLLRNSLGRITDRIVRIEARVAKTEDALAVTVKDEEWIRESMRLRNSVKEISNLLYKMDGKSEAILQIAQSMTQMGTAVESSAKELARIANEIKGSAA